MSISCIDRNMPGNYPYTFSILDSSYNNLVGDSVNVNRYDIDSMYIYHRKLKDFFQIENTTGVYVFKGYHRENSKSDYVISYNSVEKDSVIVDQKSNYIKIYLNAELIYEKDHISQTTDIHFNILK